MLTTFAVQNGKMVYQKDMVMVFLKVAVKWLAHAINCFINIAEAKPFTILKSRYLLNNTGSW